MYCEPRVTLLDSITALCDNVNLEYNISVDSTNHTAVAQLLTHGLNLSESESNTVISINSAIFGHFSKYISQTCRFMKTL